MEGFFLSFSWFLWFARGALLGRLIRWEMMALVRARPLKSFWSDGLAPAKLFHVETGTGNVPHPSHPRGTSGTTTLPHPCPVRLYAFSTIPDRTPNK